MPDLNQPRLFEDLGPHINEMPATSLNANQFMDRAQWHATRPKKWPFLPEKRHPKKGSFPGEWDQTVRDSGVDVHAGTPYAAAQRADAKYGLDNMTEYYPVVPNKVRAAKPVHDVLGQPSRLRYAAEAPTAPRDQRRAGEAFAHRGESIPYWNSAEDRGSKSYAIPDGSFTSLRDLGMPRAHLNPREFGDVLSEHQPVRGPSRQWQRNVKNLRGPRPKPPKQGTLF